MSEYHTDAQSLRWQGHPYNKTIHCPELNLDGGNIIKCDESIIVSDRVFDENSHLTKHKITDLLERIFECEVIIILGDSEEGTGHADGMVRYIGNNTLLLNHYCDFDKDLKNKLLKRLSPEFNVLGLHFGTMKYLATS